MAALLSSAYPGTRARAFLTGAMAWLAVILMALAIGLLSARSPRFAVAAVAAGLLGWLVLRRTVTLLVPMAVLVLAWDSTVLPSAGVSFQAKFLMLAAVAAMALPSLVAPIEGHPPVPRAFGVGFFVLALLGTVSAAWSIVPEFSLQRGISITLVWAAVVLAVPLSLRGDDQIREIVRRNALVLALLTGAGLVLGLAGAVAAFQGDGRFLGLMINPNTIGYFAAPILPPAVLLVAQMRPGRQRLVLFVAILVIGAGIALSGSRAGVLAAFVGITVGLVLAGKFRQSRQARRAFVLLTLIVIAGVVVFPALGLTARSGGQSVEGFLEIGGGSGRELNWVHALPLVTEEPVFGHGLGSTPTLFPQVQSLTQSVILGGAHNSYLEAAIDLGLVGALLLTVLATSGLVAAVRLAHSEGAGSRLGPLLAAGITAGLIEAFFETGMLAAGGVFAFPFWLCVGLAHSLLARERMMSQGRPRLTVS
jgi:exopolysaccharide production protein ExoQ